MIVEIRVWIDDHYKTYTVYKEDMQQMVCNKAREDNPNARTISCPTDTIDIKIKG